MKVLSPGPIATPMQDQVSDTSGDSRHRLRRRRRAVERSGVSAGFAGDLPEPKAKVLYAVQQPFHKSLLAAKTTQAAWRSKPSFYAVSRDDRTINPDVQRFMAKRRGAKTIEVKASHVSLISQPE
jgi:Alpha/beta hydrolase family